MNGCIHRLLDQLLNDNVLYRREVTSGKGELQPRDALGLVWFPLQINKIHGTFSGGYKVLQPFLSTVPHPLACVPDIEKTFKESSNLDALHQCSLTIQCFHTDRIICIIVRDRS